MRRHPPRSPARNRPSEAEVTVQGIGARGDGIAEHGGRKLFVPLAAPGDRVRVRLGETRGDGIAAELIELVQPGAERASPPCPHFGACGGCSLQHLNDQAYASWKHALVVQALEHRGLGGVAVAPPLRMPPATRRRVTLAARRGRNAVFLGFHERQSNRVVEIGLCLVARPEIVALLDPLRQLLAAVLGEGEGADLALTVLDDGVDLVVAAGRPPRLEDRERLAAFAAERDLARLSWRDGDAPAEPVAHRRSGVRRFGGVPVVVPPGAFLQASEEGEAALLGLVRDGIGGAARVADLFAGMGTFALPLAAGAKVLAVDGDAAAVAALDQAARQGRIAVEARRRDLFRDPLDAGELDGFDAVLFDPPRAGARDQASRIAQSAVPVVVGVSCSPPSFARDARILVDGGYRLERVVPVDQFVWSAHVELVGVFRRG